MPFRHSPEQALLVVEENILRHFQLVALDGADYAALIREVALAGILGGTVYDAILIKAAGKADVERIYTLNLKHFQAVAPASLRELLTSP
jgi:hypothetical protein